MPRVHRAACVLLTLVCPLIACCGAKTGLQEPSRDDDAGTSCIATPERCNGLDDDCDGAIDDGLACFFLNGEPIEAVPSQQCGANWYRYDTPDSQSANPVPDIRRSGEVVVAIQAGQACTGAHVAIIADLPQDGSGGELDADFSISPPSAGGIVVGDEPSECGYEPDTGNGRCNWVWQPCCTDGALLGPFVTDACLTLQLSRPVGLSKLVVLDGAAGEVPQAFGAPLELCAQVRPAVP